MTSNDDNDDSQRHELPADPIDHTVTTWAGLLTQAWSDLTRADRLMIDSAEQGEDADQNASKVYAAQEALVCHYERKLAGEPPRNMTEAAVLALFAYAASDNIDIPDRLAARQLRDFLLKQIGERNAEKVRGLLPDYCIE